MSSRRVPIRPRTLKRDGHRRHASRTPKSAPGQSILVQETYDPAWHAWSGGKPLTVRKDAMGLMVIDAPPGDQEISLAFVTPLENQVGRVVTLLTLLAIAGAVLVVGLRRGADARDRANRETTIAARGRLLLALLILALNLWLNAPLFMPGELPFRGSVEGGYVGMARFLSAASQSVGLESLALLRAAGAVHVRARAAVSDRARHAPAAARRRRTRSTAPSSRWPPAWVR